MTKILFVDDEPKVLNGLRRMLRNYRNDWDMDFCEGPLTALELLTTHRFDVVVTDMRMPTMDGAELLSHVRELSPETVRIILSGQSEQERLVRAIGPAHQFLSKPCCPEMLRSTITKACNLRDRLHNEKLKSFVSCLESMPSLPEVYVALVEEVRKEDGSVAEVGKLIERDISMTATVLRLVNSSLFGLNTHITEAKHAAALLGLNTLKPLVLAAGVFRQIAGAPIPHKFMSDLFEHSLQVAGAAKRLAVESHSSAQIVINSFMVGILHDMGKIVMAENLMDQYSKLCKMADLEHVPVHHLELDEYGTTHAEVGGYLLSLWGMPQELIEGVTLHHDPSASSDDSFTALTAVHLANTLCRCEASQLECSIGLDKKYLNRIQLEANLEHWREMADRPLAVV